MKQTLRSKFKQIRTTLDKEFTFKADVVIGSSLLSFINSLPHSNCIAGFFPINNEVNILDAFSTEHNRIFALPAIDGENLEFRQWDFSSNLVENKFCPEPLKSAPTVIPNVIIVPCLSFDRNGHRLGYGKGFYDRTLSMEKYKNSFKIGVCYSIQEHDSLPSLEHDVKLDALITELEIIVFPHAKN